MYIKWLLQMPKMLTLLFRSIETWKVPRNRIILFVRNGSERSKECPGPHIEEVLVVECIRFSMLEGTSTTRVDCACRWFVWNVLYLV